MKKSILLMVLTLLNLCPFSSKGQVYQNIREESNWAYGGGYPWYMKLMDGKMQFSENFYVLGKQEKNGKIYFTVQFMRGYTEDGARTSVVEEDEDEKYMFHVDWNTRNINIREENGKFLVDKEEYMTLLNDESYGGRVGNPEYVPYETTEDKELVLYDFTKREGDVYAYSQEGEPITVASVESFVADDKSSRILMTLSNNLKIIEGIGCINSPGTLIYYLNPGKRNHQICLLGWYGYKYAPGNLNLIFFQSFKDAAREIVAGISDAVQYDYDNVIYDLQGRRLMQQPRKGVYIRDGRKVAVK